MTMAAHGGASGWRRQFGRTITPYVFVLLPLVYLAIFMFGPLGREIWMSFTNTRIINPNGGSFVGTRNYDRLFHDGAFYGSLWLTALYALCALAFGVTLGVISALAINRPFPGRAIVRAILLFGWAVPNVAAALIWLWMYNGHSGVLNAITTALGIGDLPWLTSTELSLTSVLIVTVWQVAPFVMLVVLAALQSVPEEVREAARIDGADALSIFRAVTWPHILPAVQLVSLLVAIWSIRRFDIIYLLTGGGPLGSTSTLVLRIRQVAFENYDLGTASAYGVIGLVLALAVAAIHVTIEQRRLKALAR